MIYIITHKIFDDKNINRNYYDILHVGKNKNCKSYYLRDDTGNNISDKNENFCELTGLFWVLNNCNISDFEITGLLHYRRYFTTNIKHLKYSYINKMPEMLDYNSIENALKKHDIILPRKIKIFRNIQDFYADAHNGEDLLITRKAIEKIYPEYLPDFDKVMKKHEYYYGNMMICKGNILKKYSSWLFDILFLAEDKIDINKYETAYQRRVFGFLAERLLQVWVLHNKLKVKEYPVYNTEEKNLTFFDKNKIRLKKILKK